jgi:hypothetical protein
MLGGKVRRTIKTTTRWEDNIKMGIRKIVLGSMAWVDLAQVRDQWRALLNTIVTLRIP